MTWLLVGLLSLIVWWSTVAQGGRDKCDQWSRATWIPLFCLIGIALWIRNPWAALCVGMVAAGMLTVVPPSDVWARAGYPALAAAGAYAALTPHMTPAMVEPILWVFLAVGCWMGFWTDFSRQQGFTPYMHHWPAPKKGKWWTGVCLHEDSPTHLKAGQGNANHLQSAAALCVAAMIGLCLLGKLEALLAWPLVLQPLFRRVTLGFRWGQGHLHLVTLIIATLLLLPHNGIIFSLGLILYALVLIYIGRPWNPRMGWIDGYRIPMWKVVAEEWWTKSTWRQRLFGLGTGTWMPYTAPITMPRFGHVVFTAAHNEWLQWTVEHGIVGLVFLLLYASGVVGRLWHGGVEGHVMLLMVLTLCSIATVNFPWTWFHEVPQPPRCKHCGKLGPNMIVAKPNAVCRCPNPVPMPSQPYYVGSPALVGMSLVVAILIEAF